MAALEAAIQRHMLAIAGRWMAGSGPAMTNDEVEYHPDPERTL